MRRALYPLAALAMLAVTVAGCSSTSGGTGKGAGKSTAGTTTTRTRIVSIRTKAVKFAECMRANGIGAFPDPDASGDLTIDAVANGSSLDTSSAAFEQAVGACKSLEPPGFTGQERSPQEQQGALAFARCVRQDGVPDFPDPAPNAPLVDTNRIPSSARPGGMSILNAAMRKCSAYAAAAGVRPGQ